MESASNNHTFGELLAPTWTSIWWTTGLAMCLDPDSRYPNLPVNFVRDHKTNLEIYVSVFSSLPQTEWLQNVVIWRSSCTNPYTYCSFWVAKIYFEWTHGSYDSYHGLDGITIHHWFILLTIIFRVTFFMDNSVKQQSRDRKKKRKIVKISTFAKNCFILTLTLLQGWWGRCEKNYMYLPKEEGSVEKKSTRSVPAGPGARTRDLPRARRGSPAARQGGCLDKQAFPCL